MNRYPNNVTKAALRVLFKRESVCTIVSEEALSFNPNILPMKSEVTPKPVLQVKVRSLVILGQTTKFTKLNDTGYTWVG